MEKVIWSSDINLENYEDYFKEEFPNEELSLEEKYDKAYELNEEYLNCEKMNLDIPVPNGIVVVGTIGTWQGRRDGVYKFSLDNVNECLRSFMDGCHSYLKFYVDNDDFMGREAHHDGTNYYIFREWNEDVSEEDKERFIDEGISENQIGQYTKSLRPRIAEVYGW